MKGNVATIATTKTRIWKVVRHSKNNGDQELEGDVVMEATTNRREWKETQPQQQEQRRESGR